MIKHFFKQYRIFKEADFSTKDAIIFTLRGMQIDFYFSRQKLKRKLRNFFK